MEPTYLTIYQALLDGSDLSDIPQEILEKNLPRALVQAIAEQNTTVFISAENHLNTMSNQGMTVSDCYRDIHAAKSVGKMLGLLPSNGHMVTPTEFEKDFVRMWVLASELKDLTLCDQLFDYAVRVDITPLKCAEKSYGDEWWNIYRNLAQRNEFVRLQKMESVFGLLKQTLSVYYPKMSEMMRSPVFDAIHVITETIAFDAWDTYKLLLPMLASTRNSFSVKVIARACLTLDPKYLNKMFEVCTDRQQWIFDCFLEHTDEKNTVSLHQFLQQVENASDECLQYLVSEAYNRNTTCREAIAQCAESVLQKKVLSEIVKNDGASSKTLKI